MGSIETSDVLQLIGSGLELTGLVLIALGISDRRRLLWPGKRHFVIRLWRWFVALLGKGWRWFVALLGRFQLWFRFRILHKKPPSQTIQVAGTVSAGAFGTATVTVTPRSWEGLSPDETLDLIRERIDEHHKKLDELATRVDLESKNRTGAIQALDAKLPNMKEEFRELVKEAAAGDLGKDAWGVFLFLLGVVFSLCGNIMA